MRRMTNSCTNIMSPGAPSSSAVITSGSTVMLISLKSNTPLLHSCCCCDDTVGDDVESVDEADDEVVSSKVEVGDVGTAVGVGWSEVGGSE